ncbi:MAG: biotin--[acetyl-CoA-carboxylase] ligase [Flavobacterium sp.]|nr:MAG: biotin--[acetyl-CoA-carboxylase] ligase [Flavobacterium sp.]
MPLVKLDATESTNDYLKEMAANGAVENFTVVTAESQTAGRGQMGSKWVSEKGKNLTMSMLITNTLSDICGIFNLNVAVALSVIVTLEKHDIADISIKWPNDIMAGAKKIGGILIENVIKSNGEIQSIAGIGLNVNQLDFSGLPKASSLAVVAGKEFDKDEIRERLTQNIVNNISFLAEHSDVLWQAYHDKLFKKGVPMAFEGTDGNRFMGIIERVDSTGKLELLLEDDSRKTFGIKEIQMLY